MTLQKVRLIDGSGAHEYYLAEAVDAELAALRSESESRRVTLDSKAAELRTEWIRAENAEAEMDFYRGLVNDMINARDIDAARVYIMRVLAKRQKELAVKP